MYAETGLARDLDGAVAEAEETRNPSRHATPGTQREATVIALHGGASDLGAWDPLRQALLPEVRFIALAWRPVEPGLSPVDDLADLVHELRSGPVDLLGWSLGGAIALHAALRQPDLIRSLTLYDPTLPEILDHVPGGEELTEDFLRDHTGSLLPSLKPLTASAVSKLAMPSLLVTGEMSHPGHQIIVEWLAARMPKATECIWPDAGHRGLVDNPDVAGPEIAGFLRAIRGWD